MNEQDGKKDKGARGPSRRSFLKGTAAAIGGLSFTFLSPQGDRQLRRA